MAYSMVKTPPEHGVSHKSSLFPRRKKTSINLETGGQSHWRTVTSKSSAGYWQTDSKKLFLLLYMKLRQGLSGADAYTNQPSLLTVFCMYNQDIAICSH